MSEETAGAAGTGAQPSEEELRAALEEELKRITVDDVLLQTAVSLVNLGGRRAGLAPGTEQERDLDQLRSAIEGVRALLPLLEEKHGDRLGPLRDGLSQLQLAYARQREADAGEGEPAAAAETAQGEQGETQESRRPGPAESSGRLWTPGS